MELTEKNTELTNEEWWKYFSEGIIFSALPFMIEAVGKMASELYDMKYCDKGRWWYGEWEGDRRKIITVDCPKGIMRNICWGWNYNYIPHPTGKGTFKYARTEKAFSLDAVDSYMKHTEYPDLYYDNDNRYMERIILSRKYALPSWTNNAEIARDHMETVCRRNIPFIKEYFERTKTDCGVIEDIDRFSYAYSDPFHYLLWGQNYAKAFILAKNGGIEEAERGFSDEKTLARLRRVYKDGRSGS
ncbi:MAG: hypothetical protein NC120_10985 [Ruminococcus sp.]|nr:hypothetical protein [Ruminococcus sp.]